MAMLRRCLQLDMFFHYSGLHWNHRDVSPGNPIARHAELSWRYLVLCNYLRYVANLPFHWRIRHQAMYLLQADGSGRAGNRRRMHLAAQHGSWLASGCSGWLVRSPAGWFSHFWLAPVPTLAGWLAARLQLALRLLLAVPTCLAYLTCVSDCSVSPAPCLLPFIILPSISSLHQNRAQAGMASVQ